MEFHFLKQKSFMRASFCALEILQCSKSKGIFFAILETADRVNIENMKLDQMLDPLGQAWQSGSALAA